MPKMYCNFGKPPSCWNLEHACPRPESDFCLTPPLGIQSQPSNAAEMEASLRRAASQTARSRVDPGFIPHDAFSSPHAHLDEETARIAALAYEAGFVIKSLDSFREDLGGSAIATRMRTLSNNKYVVISYVRHVLPI